MEPDPASSSCSPPAPAPDAKSSDDYLSFLCLPPGGPLNRWSANLTREHDLPAAQVRPRSAAAYQQPALTACPPRRCSTVLESPTARP